MSQPIHIYLAGGITGLTEAEAKAWRELAIERLGPQIKGINPLRCEPMQGDSGRYIAEDQASDLKFGHPKAVKAKNFIDVQRCDLLLAYLPEPSSGTFIEIGWADAMGKPIIIVSQNPKIVNHPVISACADWPIQPTLRDAIKIIRGVFDGYAN